MSKLKAVYFCGHKSPFGRAHLAPILEMDQIELVAVVLATDNCWARFAEKLDGKQYVSTHKRGLKDVHFAIKQLFYKLIRRKNRDFARIEKFLNSNNVPIIFSDDINSTEFVDKIRNLNIDLLLCAAYPQIFKESILSIAPKGAINFHPSLLPKYRGAHPHFWAILNGEVSSGITAHYMTVNIDDGDIIAQISYEIKDLNYSQLYGKILEETPNLLKQVDQFLADPNATATPQDNTQVTFYRQDREIHHKIFWAIHSSEQILNLTRTSQAFCYFNNQKIEIGTVIVNDKNRNLTNNVRVEPGTIIDFSAEGPVVKTLDACVTITEFNSEGTITNYLDWVRFNGVTIGAKFV